MKEREMVEAYLFYSSLTLFAMGCAALALFLLFRFKSRTLSDLPKNLSANVFEKSFVVFNPYSVRKANPIHGFLSVLSSAPFAIAAFAASVGASFILWKLVEAGLLLSLILLIAGLNLIIGEDESEIYETCNAFIKAVQEGNSLGVGDLRAFQTLKNTLPRITHYYLGLSVVFMALSLALPYTWPSALRFFAGYITLILGAGEPIPIVGFLVVVVPFALTVLILQIFASKAKDSLMR